MNKLSVLFNKIFFTNIGRKTIFLILVVFLYWSVRKMIFWHPAIDSLDYFFQAFEKIPTFLLIIFIIIISSIYIVKKREFENPNNTIFNFMLLFVITFHYSYERYCSDLIKFYPKGDVKYAEVIVLSFLLLFIVLIIEIIIKSNDKKIEIDSIYFSDKEISSDYGDAFGFKVPAEKLIESVERGSYQRSFVIGINAPWGRGKSSFISFVKNELLTNVKLKNKFTLIEFSPWNYIGSSSAQERYFYLLDSILKEEYNGLSDDINEYSLLLSDSITKLGFIKSITSRHRDRINPQLKLKEINNKLQKNGKKYIVVIDDLDRVHEAELREIVKMIRTTADFENFFYILCYDREYVNKVFNTNEGNHDGRYFDKIVELEVHLPYYDYSEILGSKIIDEFSSKICKIDKSDMTQANLISDYLRLFFQDQFVGDYIPSYWGYTISNTQLCLNKYINSPRVLKKSLNAFLYGYLLLKGNVVIEELIVLSILKVKYPIEWEKFITDSSFFKVDVDSILDIEQINSKIKNQEFNNLVIKLFTATEFDDTQSIKKTNYRNQYLKFGLGKSTYDNDKLEGHIKNPIYSILLKEAEQTDFADKFNDFNEKLLRRLEFSIINYDDNKLDEIVKILFSTNIIGDFFHNIYKAVLNLKRLSTFSIKVNEYLSQDKIDKDSVKKFIKNINYALSSKNIPDNFLWSRIITKETWNNILARIIKFKQGDLLIDFYKYHYSSAATINNSKNIIEYFTNYKTNKEFRDFVNKNCFDISENNYHPNVLFNIIKDFYDRGTFDNDFIKYLRFNTSDSWKVYKALLSLPIPEQDYFKNLDIIEINSSTDFKLTDYHGNAQLLGFPKDSISLNTKNQFNHFYTQFYLIYKELSISYPANIIAHAFPISKNEAKMGGNYIFKNKISLSKSWDKLFSSGRIFGQSDDFAEISINGFHVASFRYHDVDSDMLTDETINSINTSRMIEIVVSVKNIDMMDNPNIDGKLNPYWFLFSLQLH